MDGWIDGWMNGFSSRGTLSQLSRYILLFSFSSGQLVKWGPRAGVVGELPFIPGPHPPTPTEVVAVHQCFVVKKLGKCQIRSHPLGGGLLITLPIELLIELKPNGSTTGLATLLDLLNSDLAGVIRKRSWDRCESTAGAVAAARPVPLLGDPAAREPCFRVGERGDAVTRRCAVITYNPLSPSCFWPWPCLAFVAHFLLEFLSPLYPPSAHTVYRPWPSSELQPKSQVGFVDNVGIPWAHIQAGGTVEAVSTLQEQNGFWHTSCDSGTDAALPH
jgi:hypothetical protein